MPTIATRVAAVTVFGDRALVVRRGAVDLDAGAHELVVDDLPLGLVEESVRVAAHGTVPARIGGTDVRHRVHLEPVDEAVARLLRHLEDVEERELALQRDATSLEARERFLESLGSTAGRRLAREVARGSAPLELGSEIDGFLAERGAVLRTEAGEQARRRRDLAREREAILAELARVQEQRPTQRRQVAVNLEMEAAGRLELEVRYQVGEASWRPVYDLRLDETEPGIHLHLTYQALVTQRTGEPWRGMALSLSTARPALGLTVPELDPWYIAARTPQPVMAMAAGAPLASGPMRARSMALSDQDLPPPTIAAQTVVAAVESTAGAVTFRIAGDADIPSDGSPHRVTVGQWSFDCALDHVTAPRLGEHAYRRVRTHNHSEAVLLPGKAQVVVGDEVVGSTKLDMTVPGQELEIYCGVDDRIHVERELVTGSVDKRTLRDNAVRTYVYSLKVTNLIPRAASVLVRDAVPLAGHELIKVRDVTFTPRPARIDDLGRAEWELRIESEQTAELRVGFVIEHPRDLDVVVPPRR